DGGRAIEKIRSFAVAAEFFPTFGIPLVRGRGFTAAETASHARTVVISEAAARRFWPGGDPIGKTLAIDEASLAESVPSAVPAGEMVVLRPKPPAERVFLPCEIVGVTRDITTRVDDVDHLLIYLPISPETEARGSVFVRPHSDSPAALADIARAASAAG